MDEEHERELLDILTRLPSESPMLDYKIAPYDSNHKAELIKDVCSFLNCTESYEQDKFIVIGVADKEKYKKGIDNNRMPDDKYFQDLWKIIQPRPHVETGEIKFEGKWFGYILICKDNDERVYSIIKDYPEETVTREEEKNDVKTKVYASTAYIRIGSTKDLLNEYDRRRIYLQDQKIKHLGERRNYSYTLDKDEASKDILKICALFGTWNEENENEKNIISNVLKMEYDDWIKVLKELLLKKSEYISYKNKCWKIENKEELIEKYCDDYFDSDIKKFKEAAITIVKEENPQIEMTSTERMLSSKHMKYSGAIKKSVLETFAYMKSIKNKFYNCKNELKESLWYVPRTILEKSGWKIYASLDSLLPILAEINGDEYLQQLENVLNDEENIKKLFNEKSEDYFNKSYIWGINWSLEVLAWDSDSLSNVYNMYCKIAKYDKRAIEAMSKIVLPWYPQTNAKFNLRKSIIEMILKEYPDIGWKVLMNLMPNVQRNSMPICKPKWNGVPEEEPVVTVGELQKENNEYVKLAIEYSCGKIERIKDLINVMDDIPKELFDKIYATVTSEDVVRLSDDEKYVLWEENEKLIAKHKKFAKSEWALPKEAVEKLEKMSEIIKPCSSKTYLKRTFDGEYWDLYDSEKETYDELEKRIMNAQIEAVKVILKDGMEALIDFSYNVKDSIKVGIALAHIDITPEDEEKIILLFNEDSCMIAKGYVRYKYNKDGLKWLKSIQKIQLTDKGKTNLLTQLPNNENSWKIAGEWLKENEIEYWKSNDIRVVEGGGDYNYPIQKLIEADRPIKALELINMALFEKKEFNKKLSDEALLKALDKQDDINYIDVYDIKNIIKDLQLSNYDEERLFQIEWSYLPLLSDDDEYRPITIEKRISKDPSTINDLLCLAYKAHKDEKNNQNSDEKLAINAYRLLNILKVVPGYDENGVMNKDDLNKWISDVIKIAKENDREEVALMTIGHLLYYTKKDEDGFWIDRNVAEILNKEENEIMRRGYSTKAFNAVGVINIDKEGTAWLNLEQKWKERAEACQEGYFRFANTLKKLAQTFHDNAEYEKDNYPDF